jgi:predicted lipoprotein with Yx(FWY)xxD motif
VGSSKGTSLSRRSLCGTAGAGLLIATGAIHLDLYETGYRSIPTIGWLFLLQVIAAFALALAVLVTIRAVIAFPLAAAAGALFALATLGGYLLSLRFGLFGFREVRTTAGIVAGVIDVAAFAALAAAVLLSPFALAITGLFRRPLTALLTGVAVIAIAAAVLLGVGVAASGPSAAPAVAGGQQAGGQQLRTEHASGTTVLANAKGLTLYWFAPDTATASRCYGECATYWPPVPGSVTAGPGVTGKLGKITRSDGSTQATYDGRPLYTYVGDGRPGQATGNNLDLNGGLWHEVTP